MEAHKDYDCFEKKFTIGNVSVGGNFGEIPTVLIGSIFYMHHRLVKDAEEGIFDEEKVTSIVKNCEELSEKLGNRFMLDVIGNTPKALVRYITFLRSITKAPLLVNAPLPEVRIQALQELNRMGQLDGIIYNSINAFSTEEELQALAKLPIDATIIQAYNTGSKKPDGPLKTLTGTSKKEGFLEKAKRAGMTKVMVDIPTLDMSSIGMIPHAGVCIKEELGLPVGTAPSNATYASPWFRNKENISTEQFRAVDATVSSYLAAMGCNFLFIGPVEGYRWILPATAAVNAFHVYGMRSQGVKPETEDHPMFRVL